jgi:ADP-Ribosyltransferase in polyvalent proteins
MFEKYRYSSYDSHPKQRQQKLGLPSATRDERASKLGFNPKDVWYHGTNRNFHEIDLSKAGTMSQGEKSPGFWITKDRAYANEYAEIASSRHGGKHIVKEFLIAPKNPVEAIVHESLKQVEIGGKKFDFTSNAEVVRHAMLKGHDAVLWRDGSFTDPPSATILKENIIRNTTAEFARSGRNLSAGVMLTGAMGASAVAYSKHKADGGAQPMSALAGGPAPAPVPGSTAGATAMAAATGGTVLAVGAGMMKGLQIAGRMAVAVAPRVGGMLVPGVGVVLTAKLGYDAVQGYRKGGMAGALDTVTGGAATHFAEKRAQRSGYVRKDGQQVQATEAQAAAYAARKKP